MTKHADDTPLWESRAAAIIGGVTLAILIFSMHGRCLTHGLFMDDYAHYSQLQECDWSLKGLAGACRLELVGGVVDMWWLPETTLRFFRPAAFGFMKLTYTLFNWNPTAMHAASLLWHWLACVLIMQLLKRLGTPGLPAWCAAALFAMHPGDVACVQWIACQSELIVTVFLLSATLCYARFRGWDKRLSGVGDWRWALGALASFCVALGCRENAIMFPAVVFLGELGANWKKSKKPWLLWGLLGVAAIAYLGVRAWALNGAQLPPRPYIMPPSSPDFPRFVFDKVCYYLLGEFLLAPVVPLGGIPYLRTQPLLFYGATALIVLGLGVLTWRWRKTRMGLLAPAWLLLYMAPVLPAFASPHHLYLPGVGWALFFGLILRTIVGEHAAEHAVPKRRLALGAVVIAGAAGVFAPLCFIFSYYTLDNAQQVEDVVAREIAMAPVPVQDGDTIYISSLPLIAHYAQIIVEQRTGLKDLRVVPLLWSPRLLGTHTDATLTMPDERTVEIRLAPGKAGDSYFGGPLGRVAGEANGSTMEKMLAQPLECKDFTIERLDAGNDGIRALRFTFREPLTRPGVHFFWASRERWAYQILPGETPPWTTTQSSPPCDRSTSPQ